MDPTCLHQWCKEFQHSADDSGNQAALFCLFQGNLLGLLHSIYKIPADIPDGCHAVHENCAFIMQIQAAVVQIDRTHHRLGIVA